MFGQAPGGPPDGGGSSGGGSSGGGSSGGGSGSNSPYNCVHNDQLMKAYFGYESRVFDYVAEAPSEWEHWLDYSGDGAWSASRHFGAMVVANRNDSNSDRVVDLMDAFTGSPFDNLEPDLIKLEINIPDWGPHHECHVSARVWRLFSGSFPILVPWPSEDVRFFASPQKAELSTIAGITPVPGGVVNPMKPEYRPAKGFEITNSGEYTVYVEVHSASQFASDFDIELVLRKPMPSTESGEYDRVNVTSVWSGEQRVVTTRSEREIIHIGEYEDDVDGPEGPAWPTSGMVIYDRLPGTLPTLNELPPLDIGEYIVIFDDNFSAPNENGVWTKSGYNWGIYAEELWKSNEENATSKHSMARQWVMAQIIGIQEDGGYRLLFPLIPDLTYGDPEMITKFDRFAYSLNKNVAIEADWLHEIVNLNGQRIGVDSINGKYRPTGRNGIEIQFVVSPSDLFSKQMSNGERVKVDTARQAHGGIREIFFNNEPEVDHEEKTFPQEDELPNDSPGNWDTDFWAERDNNVITVLDGPGCREEMDYDKSQWRRFQTSKRYDFEGNPRPENSFIIRQDADMKEFLRIRFIGQDVTRSYPKNELWGSRASDKVRWHSKHAVSPDESRPVVAAEGFDPTWYSRAHDLFQNSIEVGPYPADAYFDSRFPRDHDH